MKTKIIRKPLQPLKNIITPSLFDDIDSSPELNLRRSVQSKQAVAVDDTFDKLFDNVPEKTDPFDKLFENVDKNAANDPFDRLLTDLTPNPTPTNHSLYHSVFSTPNMSEEMTTDTSGQPGLFSSFSKQTETEKTPKLKRLKSNRNIRTKKQSAKDFLTIAKPRENILSETLAVKIVFEGDTTPDDKIQPYQASSLANLIPQSPTRGRPLATLSVATSTPVLSSKSSDRVLSSGSSPGPSMMLSPVQDAPLEDDVFLRQVSALSTNSPPPVSKPAPVPSDELYSPTPQKSFVNKSRGNPKFGGPAASLMNHIGWNFDLATIPIRSNTSSTSMASAHETSLMESVREDEDLEVTVNIACVCGNNQMTSSFVIQCDHCGLWFHTDCVRLSETCIEELEREELDWFCNKCIEEAENNPDMTKNFTISTPFKMAETSHGSSRVVSGVTVASTYSSTLSEPSVVSISLASLPSSPTHVIHVDSVASSFSVSLAEIPANPSPPPSPTISMLSLTAQLEEHHMANMDTVQDASLMFIKPSDPPAKRAARKAAPAEEEVQLKAGKSWRRSLCQAKRSVSRASKTRLTSLTEVRQAPHVNNEDVQAGSVVKDVSSLETSVEIIDPTPVKPPTRRSTRLAPIPSEDELILPTPQKFIPKHSLCKLGRSSRSSFCVVPATPRLSKVGGERLSVLHTLSETLLVVKMSETVLVSEDPHPPSVELTAVEKLLAACSKTTILTYDDIYPPDVMEGSKKVGEGRFGEVFLLGAAGEDRPVLKVVPIDGDIPVNGETQTTVEDMLSEVIISNALSKLRVEAENVTAGFVEVRGCHVFQGAYPPQLLELWDEYDKEHQSENDRPDNPPVEQKFIALEFNNGGKDLEKYTFKHASQALQAWKQVVHSLAVAEEELQFEHRDLHWGNVLVKETKEKFVNFTLGGDTFQVRYRN